MAHAGEGKGGRGEDLEGKDVARPILCIRAHPQTELLEVLTPQPLLTLSRHLPRQTAVHPRLAAIRASRGPRGWVREVLPRGARLPPLSRAALHRGPGKKPATKRVEGMSGEAQSTGWFTGQEPQESIRAAAADTPPAHAPHGEKRASKRASKKRASTRVSSQSGPSQSTGWRTGQVTAKSASAPLPPSRRSTTRICQPHCFVFLTESQGECW